MTPPGDRSFGERGVRMLHIEDRDRKRVLDSGMFPT